MVRRAEQRDYFVNNFPKCRILCLSPWNIPPDSGGSHGNDSWVGQYFLNNTDFQQLELVYPRIEEFTQSDELGENVVGWSTMYDSSNLKAFV